MCHHKLHTSLFYCLDHSIAICQCQCHRFLTEDIFACFRCRYDHFSMAVRFTSNNYCLNFRMMNNILDMWRIGHTELISSCLSTFLVVVPTGNDLCIIKIDYLVTVSIDMTVCETNNTNANLRKHQIVPSNMISLVPYYFVNIQLKVIVTNT